jgi:protein-S-isoprenylcysteine O-methyltransferase Ste14
MNPKLILRFAFREIMGIAFVGVALFWSAGRVDWWSGWAMVAILLGWILTTAIVILRINPDLLAERLGPGKGAKSWDTAIMGIVGMASLARLIVAGLDQRYAWTGDFPLALQIGALVACVLGYTVVVWATASNAFFSQIVRIQAERAHAVATGGPYRVVRHPAYVGTILFELAAPILLASWWAFIPGVLNAILFVIRTDLEDRTLQTELIGYADYAHQVRYRLVPSIW